MIIKGQSNAGQPGRTFYELEGFTFPLQHFVTRITTPDNPFPSHEHEQKELWFIINGAGFLERNGVTERVSKGDLIRIDPWVRHGLRTDEVIEWVCLG